MFLKRSTILLFCIALVCFVFINQAQACNELDKNSTIPDNFGASFYTLDTQQDMIIEADCSQEDEVSMTVGNGSNLQYIYEKGYIYNNNNWEEVELQGMDKVESWLRGSAIAVFNEDDFDFSNKKYFVAFICTWTDEGWKCGCRDEDCDQSYWQLQIVNRNLGQEGEIIDNENSDEEGDEGDGEEGDDSEESGCIDVDRDKFDDCEIGELDDDGRALDCDDDKRYVNPNARETCDNIDNDCDGDIDEGCDDDEDGYCDANLLFYLNDNEYLDICEFSKDTGTEKGDDCNDIDGKKSPGAEEFCDNIDNDCDGKVDEGAACCADEDQDGFNTCSPNIEGDDGKIKDCDDTNDGVYPGATEVCDLVDNDCDGQVDPDCDCLDGATKVCGTDVGECQAGSQICENGVWSDCIDQTEATEEICDSLDNDCDGEVDEGACDEEHPVVYEFDVNPKESADSVKINFSARDDVALERIEVWRTSDLSDNPNVNNWQLIYTRSAYGDNYLGGVYTDKPGVGSWWYGLHVVDTSEKCSTENNADCTTNIVMSEDGFETIQIEVAAISNCQDKDQDGYDNCSPGDVGDDGKVVDCNDNEFYASPAYGYETCDTVDNNCDGQIDEGCDEDGDGFCNREKTIYRTNSMCSKTVYVEGRSGNDCNDNDPDLNPGKKEECDSIDNNCNDETDENCECVNGREKECGTNVGACQTGIQTCQNGYWGLCQGGISAEEEVCDGIDNNCNGQTDENLVVPYNDNQEGVCEGSKKVCGGTSFWLNDYNNVLYNEYPDEESCDELDNNCDGVVDENCTCVNGETVVCGSDVGACQTGVQVCENGQLSLECQGEVTPKTEVCGNNIDEDCDGEAAVCVNIILDIIEPSMSAAKENYEVIFTASALNGVLPYTYNWTSDIDGLIYRGSQASFSYSNLSLGNHEIVLSVTDAENNTKSQNMSFTIQEKDKIYSPIMGMDQIALAGQDLYFSTWTENGVAPFSYTWTSDLDGPIGTEANIVVSTLSEGLHTIVLNVTDSEGEAYTDAIQMTIEPDLVINEVIPSSEKYEENKLVQFSAYVSGGIGTLSYVWESDIDGLLSSEQFFAALTGTGDFESDGDRYEAGSDIGGSDEELIINFEGPNLSSGLHNITVTVTDSYQNQTSQTVVVEVLEVSCFDQDGDDYGAYYIGLCPSYGLDCDDDDPSINPSINEICPNTVDENCNGLTDDCPVAFSIISPEATNNIWGEQLRVAVEFAEAVDNVRVRVLDSSDNVIRSMTLYDNGATNGDVTAGDLVYEGSFGFFEAPGSYYVEVYEYRLNTLSYFRNLSERQSFMVSGAMPVCNTILNSGDSEEKLDIVFVADQYEAGELSIFDQKAEDAKDYLLNFVPFDSHQAKINVHTINSVVDIEPDNVTYLDLQKIAAVCPYDTIVVLANGSFRSFASFAGYAVVSAPKSGYEWVVVHELGHAFANLRDEYIEDDKEVTSSFVDNSINCDTDSNCSKWENFPDTGCFDGCAYSLGYYRSVNSGTMRSSGAMDFGAWNINHINSLFNDNYQ